MLEIGSLVDGKYKVLRVVGKGGMSVVYQAVNEKANKIWAIKEVRKDGVQNFEVVKQNLIVETELLKRFNHPHLPSIVDVIDTDDSFLIVMDYIEGNSLSKALEESGAQNQEDVVEWAKQLCDVLGYLHSRKPPIIYRDMKPANVMLKPDGNISLIDFGTAREFKSSSVEDTTCLGTQGYAAPEQYGGHGQTDARTDIYCLGATMYHLVTGHNPSMPPYEMYPIRQWNPALSSGLEQIIIKCTQRNPADRYQSCAELLYDLEHYRDLDIENQRSQNTKWKVFLTCVIIMVVMALGAVGCKIGENLAKASTYDGKIAEAAKVDHDNAVELYHDAIDLEPTKPDAYLELLSLYKSDNILADEEYLDMDQLLLKTDAEKMSSEDYANLAKMLGDAAFFSIGADTDETKGYQHASAWYQKVLDNSKDQELISKTEHLQTITKSYNEKSSALSLDVTGGRIGVDDGELFNDMKSVVMNGELEDNLMIRLRCYKVVTNLLYERNSAFLKAVGEDEYNGLVNYISDTIEQIAGTEEYRQNSGTSGANGGIYENLLERTRDDIRYIRGGNADETAAE